MPRSSFRVPGEINANDLTIDTTTITVDDTNNRVGIVNASPSYALDVVGIVKGSDGLVTLTTSGAPGTTVPDGGLAVDTTNHQFYFRSGSSWRQVSSTKVATFTISGTLFVGAGQARWYAPGSITITGVTVAVGTAPTGASLIFDVNKNGTTIFTTQANRPTITAGAFTDLSNTPDVTSLTSSDYLTIDIDQIGSTIAGANATIQILYT